MLDEHPSDSAHVQCAIRRTTLTALAALISCAPVWTTSIAEGRQAGPSAQTGRASQAGGANQTSQARQTGRQTGRASQAGQTSQAGASRLVIHGAGDGHGVGMSQDGALGYAERGWSYTEILGHYYTGTAIGQAPPNAVVRVLMHGKVKRIALEAYVR